MLFNAKGNVHPHGKTGSRVDLSLSIAKAPPVVREFLEGDLEAWVLPEQIFPEKGDLTTIRITIYRPGDVEESPDKICKVQRSRGRLRIPIKGSLVEALPHPMPMGKYAGTVGLVIADGRTYLNYLLQSGKS